MSRNLKRYTVILEDGKSSFVGTVFEITALARRRKNTESLSVNFLHDRIRTLSSDEGRGPSPIPITKLIRPKCTCTEKATIRAPANARRYSGVEGFDNSVTATDVWTHMVAANGHHLPTRHTIYMRLERGFRDRDSLLHGNKTEHKPAVHPKPLRPMHDHDIVIPRIWCQGGKPYYRPGCLEPWPELKEALE